MDFKLAGTNKGITALQVNCLCLTLLLKRAEKRNKLTQTEIQILTRAHLDLCALQADVKIAGLPLKLVMEAIQQATGNIVNTGEGNSPF